MQDDVDAVGIAQRVFLDLSKGTMSLLGARAILDARTTFQHLESLSVDDNFLDDEVIELLKTIGPSVVFNEQKDDDLSIPGEVHRYVSMAEEQLRT